MDLAVLIFLSSGLFLGWSLGANDASNVFGTAVGSRMIRFGTAAALCSAFILLGAVVSGAGAAHGLGELGAVNAIGGAFTVALAAAATVYLMTKSGLPVSTTQAIVGAIVGWNLFSGSVTNVAVLSKIAGTWVAAPILGALSALVIYGLLRLVIRHGRVHLLTLDYRTRMGLVLAGIFGSYSLGANNIGNVMGVFLSSSPFTDFDLAGLFTVTSVQQLFFLGALAIGVGVFTYSKRVMMTVGRGILPLTPVGAFVSVVSHSLVLFLFSSVALQGFLIRHGLSPVPLIPVSSSQAIVGAVIGIALCKGRRGLRQVQWGKVAGIVVGWIATPIVAGTIGFVSLFVVQNVFDQAVFVPIEHQLATADLERLERAGIAVENLEPLHGRRMASGQELVYHARKYVELTPMQEQLLLSTTEVVQLEIEAEVLAGLDVDYLGLERVAALRKLEGRVFDRRWKLEEALAEISEAWRAKEATPLNAPYNKARRAQLEYLHKILRAPERQDDEPGST
jgi:PiT family inorganic phosphate transporter